MKRDKARLLFATAIFGTLGLVRRYIPLSSAMIALVRGAVGVAFLLAVHGCRRQRFDRAAIRQNWWRLLLSGALIGANWICLFEAYRYTTVSVASVCYYMAPVFVLLASPLVLHERMTLQQGICAAVAVCGMVLVSGVPENGFSGLRGIAYGLAAAAMYATVILLNKCIRGMTDIDRTILQLGVTALTLLPYVLLTEDLSAIHLTLPTGALLLLAGVLHTGIAYVLYFGSAHRLPAQTVAIFSYIDPVTAVLLSVLVLREPVSVPVILGILLVIGAAVVGELPLHRTSPTGKKEDAE